MTAGKLKSYLLFGLVLSIALTSLSCGPIQIERNTYRNGAPIGGHSEYLKVHMMDGSLYILDHWKVDSAGVIGDGVLLDDNRDTVISGPLRAYKAEIALLETNTPSENLAGLGLLIPAIGNVAIAIYCASNPKACFGSCPTFYINQNHHSVLVAEGFSSSIAPKLEATDVDALYNYVPENLEGGDSSRLTVTMKNEALETHVVRSVDLVAVPHSPGNRIFKTEANEYYEASSIISPIQCYGADGDALYQVRKLDGIERRSWTDSNDLAQKETLELTFDPSSSGMYGLVIGARQTFVSTFLFYQAMSYMGSHAGDYYAALERGEPTVKDGIEDFQRVLGGIEVWVQNEQRAWVEEGEVMEMGPIATDVHLIKISCSNKPRHIRLRMSQGGWRIDYVALARLEGRRRPNIVSPVSIRKTKDQLLLNPGPRIQFVKDAIVTLPGEEYEFNYTLPTSPSRYEYFLQSRGYYLEWMRESWLKEEDQNVALAMLLNPAQASKTLARSFKQLEQTMETSFWTSKISRSTQ